MDSPPLAASLKRVAATLAGLSALAAVLAPLPHIFVAGAADPRMVAGDIAPWIVVIFIWQMVVLRATRSAESLARLPVNVFRAGLGGGGAAVLAIRLGLALAGLGGRTGVVLVMTTVESILYGLGILALGALVAYAITRTMLRDALGETARAAQTDLSLRTRFVVMTTGASFATAGILLDVVVDFETTSDRMLLGFLALGAALVAFASLVGWLVGDDIAMREQAAAAAANERDRIARELHDGVAKSVSILALEAATAASRLPEELRPELLRIQRLARLLSEEMRSIVTDVRTQGDARPLGEALRGVVQRHAPAELLIEGDLDRIGTLARFEVLRIVDEALTNAARHAGAHHMRARVAATRDRVTVEVEDDGRGIGDLDLTTLPRSGRYGLLGIRERAEILHGSAQLAESPLGGTMVRVDFPIVQP